VPVEVVMPKLGLTMASGTITRWLKIAGDEVKRRRTAGRDFNR